MASKDENSSDELLLYSNIDFVIDSVMIIVFCKKKHLSIKIAKGGFQE